MANDSQIRYLLPVMPLLISLSAVGGPGLITRLAKKNALDRLGGYKKNSALCSGHLFYPKV
jgi:hypothetical protein